MRNKKALSLFLSTAMILSLCQFPALAGAEELTDLSPDTGIEEIVIDEDDAASDSALADLWDGLETEEAPEVMEAQPEEETDDLLSDGEADEEELPLAEDAAEGEFTGYVLMNIPYEKFYASEGIPGVDAVTSATKNKPRTGTLAGGSYHVNADGTDISGIIYPVYVKDPEILSSYKQITDEDSVTITVTNRGQESTTTYTGKDALFEAPDYAYYMLKETPSRFKTLNADGSFSSVNSGIRVVSGVTGQVSMGGHHADVEISLSGTDGIEKGDAVSAVIITDDAGNHYGLRHIANIWRGTEIGWNKTDMDLSGRTIINIRYYTKNDVISYPVNIPITESAYVLMNIPYDKFYAAEGVSGVDAVTSATLNKPRTGTLAGGSYHVNADGTDITGITYPVLVTDTAMLKDYKQITDEDSVTITVTNRGQESTTTYVGKDALFEAPSYAYYTLTEKPARYKILNADGTFSAAGGRPSIVEGVTGEVSVGGHHADVEIALSGTTGIEKGDAVSAVVITDNEGNKYGLRHIANIWRGTEIGWNKTDMDLTGKTITNIRYYTQSAIIDYPVQIAVNAYAFVLMNIPYDKFYAAEGVSGVDAVTSATRNKPRTGGLAGGSYHVNADGTDITGITYPVLVTDLSMLDAYTEITDENSVTITVTNRGQESTTTYTGKDALFEAPSYAYYTLTEKPARYKTLNADGTFSAVSGRTATVEGAAGEVTLQARHATVEIALSGTTGIEKGDAVSAVVLTDNDGNKYGLRHIANLWRATEIGWNNEFNLRGKTITNIRYYTQSAVTDYPVSIEVGKLFSDVNDASLPYYNAVYWALDKGIAAGWDDNTFRPAVTINRAAVVTFLWRLAGKPEASAAAAFKDMPSNEEFAKAISWAVEQGIVTGWTEDNTFRPWKICNRAAIITFIWRYAGRPEAAAGASFQDMTKNEEFNKAISWAVEKGIASGTTDTTFTPWGLCQRADVVSFLYSYSKLR